MTLTYDKDRKIFKAFSDFHEKEILKKAKFRWNPDGRFWYSANVADAARLIEFADPSTKILIENHYNKQKVAFEASYKADTDFVPPSPEGLEFFPFQRAGVEIIKDRINNLLSDSPGLGKTVQAIGLINYLDSIGEKIESCLIICPAVVKINWMNELNKWLTNLKSISIAMPNKVQDANIVIINYDLLKKYYNSLTINDYDLVIVDESHKIKNPKAIRTKCVQDIAARAKRKLFLTGTPVLNRPGELFTTLNILDPVHYANQKEFNNRYCNIPPTWQKSRLEELHQKLRSTVMVRRRKDEVLKDLPPKMRQVIEIEPSKEDQIFIQEEMAAYNKFNAVKAEMQAKMSNIKSKSMTSALADLNPEWNQQTQEFELKIINKEEADFKISGVMSQEDQKEYNSLVERLKEASGLLFGELSRLRKRTAVAKAPYVVSYLEDLLESDEKIVVFAHHHEVIDTLLKAFNKDEEIAIKLDGRDNDVAKQRAVERFQTDDKIKVIVAGIIPAGVGITLTASSTVVFAELDWVPSNLSQAEDRCHRIGQLYSVLVIHIVFNNSLDANMAKKIVEKQKIIDQTVDNDAAYLVSNKEKVKMTDEDYEKLVSSSFKSALDNKITKEDAEKLIIPYDQNKIKTRDPNEPWYSEKERELILLALKYLAGMCDGARRVDGTGFNKNDASFGLDLAKRDFLSHKQAHAAKKMLGKYIKQIPAKLYNAIYTKTQEPQANAM